MLLVGILILATIIGPGVKAEYVLYSNWAFAVPVFNLAIFCYIAQYTVPEMSRVCRKQYKDAAKAIITGMLITCILLMLVPMAA